MFLGPNILSLMIRMSFNLQKQRKGSFMWEIYFLLSERQRGGSECPTCTGHCLSHFKNNQYATLAYLALSPNTVIWDRLLEHPWLFSLLNSCGWPVEQRQSYLTCFLAHTNLPRIICHGVSLPGTLWEPHKVSALPKLLCPMFPFSD